MDWFIFAITFNTRVLDNCKYMRVHNHSGADGRGFNPRMVGSGQRQKNRHLGSFFPGLINIHQ